jgi:hypothetical protein
MLYSKLLFDLGFMAETIRLTVRWIIHNTEFRKVYTSLNNITIQRYICIVSVIVKYDRRIPFDKSHNKIFGFYCALE